MTHFDPLGRAFLVVADNGAGGKAPTRSVLDIQGNALVVRDALGRDALTQTFGMLAASLKQISIDAGTRSTLSEIGGKPLRQWGSEASSCASPTTSCGGRRAAT